MKKVAVVIGCKDAKVWYSGREGQMFEVRRLFNDGVYVSTRDEMNTGNIIFNGDYEIYTRENKREN